jgi:hypothetical protein
VRARSANEGSGTADWPLVAPLACFPKDVEDTYALDSFFAAQRDFMSADNFFFAAALIGRRTVVFLGVVLSCFGADFPFHFAHRCFIASEMRLRAAGLIRRRFPPVDVDFGGRPRRGAGEVSPSSAEMAWSIRVRSLRSWFTKLCMSMYPPVR